MSKIEKCNPKNIFYKNGLGDRLIDPSFFPHEIKQFLNDERKILDSLSSKIDLLIEVGCMEGRYLEWAIVQNKYYLGIDIVLRYIKAGQKSVKKMKLPAEQYQFKYGSAEEITELIKSKKSSIPPERCLIFFPFNSFGNMENPIPVIRNLKKSNLPFIISTYPITKEATSIRERYYKNCKYSQLRQLKSKQGISFVSSDGLNSIAYDPIYLQDLFSLNNFTIKLISFSKIGIIYTTESVGNLLEEL